MLNKRGQKVGHVWLKCLLGVICSSVACLGLASGSAHEGVLKRKEFIRLMRQLAAAETGLSPDDIRDSRRASKTSNGSIKHGDDDAPRPASLATDFDLRQLVTMYSDAISRSDVDAVMRYFADDAVISLDSTNSLTTPEQIRQSFAEQFSTSDLIIEVPLVTAFFADEGNGTAHGNMTIERRHSKAGSKPVVDMVRGVDTYRRTSTGWRCNQRQRTTI